MYFVLLAASVCSLLLGLVMLWTDPESKTVIGRIGQILMLMSLVITAVALYYYGHEA